MTPSLVPPQGFYGVWNVAELVQDIAIRSLGGAVVQRDELYIRLGIFPSHELPAARETTVAVTLAAEEVRSLVRDLGRLRGADRTMRTESAIVRAHRWARKRKRLERDARLLLAQARIAGLRADLLDARHLELAEASRLVSKAIGLVVRLLNLLEVTKEASDRWLVDGLVRLRVDDLGKLGLATDVVFWSSAFLLAFFEDALASSSGSTYADEASG